MNQNEIEQYIMNKKKLLKYGFQQEMNQYKYQKELNQDLYMTVLVNHLLFKIDVYEKETHEKYLPFYIKCETGIYSSNIKQLVEKEIEKIKISCFEMIDKKNQILSYVKNQYQTLAEYSLAKAPSACILKTKGKQKWYGIIMNISYEKLGIDKEGTIDIINVKNKPEKIEQLIDYIHYLPAYHMNKKYWITILLDKTTDMTKIIKLINESYQITQNIK